MNQSSPPPEVPAYTTKAIAAVLAASESEHDFSGWLASVVSEVVKRRGWDAVERRQGSWEAALVEQLVQGTLGDVPLASADRALRDLTDAWGEHYEIYLTGDQWQAWHRGAPIQDMLAGGTPGELDAAIRADWARRSAR